MDNLNNNNSSSYENSLCSEELKSSSVSQHHTELQQQQQQQQQQQLHQHQVQQPKLISPHRQRAMSFLYCISKRLGRRVQREIVVSNSQDDLRSSSTDSFSLSLDRGSSCEKRIRSSSIDLSSDGHSSRASSSSGCSRLFSSGADENEEALDIDEQQEQLITLQQPQHRHSYETHCYHIVDDGQDDELIKCTTNGTSTQGRTPLKGLNLNRISISSVSRVLQHISSSSSSSTSMRSLSCNSTPLKRTSDSKKSALSSGEKKSTDNSNSTTNSTAKSSKSAKPQPQQQRILRQPTSYVYLKGMSGLPTRRVPRSSLCCSYAYR